MFTRVKAEMQFRDRSRFSLCKQLKSDFDANLCKQSMLIRVATLRCCQHDKLSREEETREEVLDDGKRF